MVNTSCNYNSKALNIDAIQCSTIKVTLGFKCKPALKIKLAEEAEEIGLTLSSYTEALIENTAQIVDVKTQQNVTVLTDQIEAQKKLIDFYESPQLKILYDTLKNQTTTYYDAKGNNVNITINTIGDVYAVLINSFQTIKK